MNIYDVLNVIYHEDHGPIWEQIHGEFHYQLRRIRRRPYIEQAGILAGILSSGSILGTYLLRKLPKQIISEVASQSNLRRITNMPRRPLTDPEERMHQLFLENEDAKSRERERFNQEMKTGQRDKSGQLIEVPTDHQGNVRRRPIPIENNQFVTPEKPSNKRTQSISPADTQVKKKLRMDTTGTNDGNNNGDVSMGLMAMGGTGSGQHQQHGETPVERIPYSRWSPFNETAQALLTYYAFKGATNLSDTTAVGWSYRLNSIYDCESIITYAADPPAVADTADATINTPKMRAYWIALYQYWTVTKCTWRVRILPINGTPDQQFTCYIYFHGLQHPPLVDGGGNVHHEYRRHHPGVIWRHINFKPAPGQGVEFSDYEYVESFSGVWYPGSIKHEVVEDELAQVWHKETEVPPVPENMTILLQPSPTNQIPNSTTQMSARMEVTLEYHTQFKDLRAVHQYIVAGSDLTAVTDYAAQAN